MSRDFAPRLLPGPPGCLALDSPYSAELVAELKSSVPRARWNGQSRQWVFPASYGPHVADICHLWLGTRPDVPAVRDSVPAAKTTWSGVILYVGRCKQRGDGTWTATGYSQSDPVGWTIVLPENVLRDWFEKTGYRPSTGSTLYGVLGVAQDAPLAEIKSAWRLLAKTWHPDVNKDPDAASQFRSIQSAWEHLSDPASRQEYDAGLRFQASCDQATGVDAPAFRRYGYGYRSPLTCGRVSCEGTWDVGVLQVTAITSWEPVRNPAGEILTSYWIAPPVDPASGRQLDPKARGKFETAWVTP